MADLSISNIINVSVSAAPTGASQYNTSNIALFTHEVPSPTFAAGYKIYKEPTEVATDFGTSSVTYRMALRAFSQQPNFLLPGGYFVVVPLEGSETLDEAVTRSVGLVAWFGGMSTWIETEQETLDTAAIVQTLDKLFFFAQRDPAELAPVTGILSLIKDASLSHSRGLYYGAPADLDALLMKAAYAGRALSVVFAGSNTTQTMHLKSLAGVVPDQLMDQTIFEASKIAGADTYVSFQGVPSVNCAGANRFFDQVYNELWFVGAIQIAGFNYLRQTSTKVPQTENGMDGLKGAYRAVCRQAVTNQYAAPGEWNSPITFGNQEDLYENIRGFGFYVYSTPIAEQLQVEREERKAPLVQIALKEAGAIQSSSVIINVNA